uniref:hypothetical protein n=1 Tax=Sphingomonas bacterium TaxID=1895847 RepID=UPI0026172382|nr:hypothetical protein [Sphingomonas bacterium]
MNLFGVFAAGILVIAGAGDQATRWLTHTNEAGFRVKYPNNWLVVAKDRDLLIISAKQKAEGAIIGIGESSIMVRKIDIGINADLQQYISHNDQTRAFLLPDIKNGNSAHGCRVIQHIVSRDTFADNIYQTYEYFFCKIDNKIFLTTYTRYSASPEKPVWRRTAIAMTRSIELTNSPR